MEEDFRSIFEKTLSSFLDRSVVIKYNGPSIFEFKKLKASLPGEVIFATLTVAEGGSGKLYFAMSKEAAAMLADLLLMGDGNAAFNHEEHLEPLKDLFKEVMASFAAELGRQLGNHMAFAESKVVLMDLAPSDFAEGGWTSGTLEVGLDSPQMIYRMVSKDFVESCFPIIESLSDGFEQVVEEQREDHEMSREMGLVLDIELPISIELGRTSMLIRDIVKLAPGSIVELDKLSGEPVDLYVNGKRFGKGEVVVVEENFAVRLTELLSADERFNASRN
jgi:flagellar motor switch protein FliN/FliY